MYGKGRMAMYLFIPDDGGSLEDLAGGMTTAKWRQLRLSPDRPGDGHRVSVDEEGTEVAASTYIGMVGSASPEYKVELTFDRPFAFAIRMPLT